MVASLSLLWPVVFLGRSGCSWGFAGVLTVDEKTNEVKYAPHPCTSATCMGSALGVKSGSSAGESGSRVESMERRTGVCGAEPAAEEALDEGSEGMLGVGCVAVDGT